MSRIVIRESSEDENDQASSDNEIDEKVSIKELDKDVKKIISSNKSVDKRLLKIYKVHRNLLNNE